MPSFPPRACTKYGCRGKSLDGSNYCAEHKPKPKSGWPAYTLKNGNRHKAGYGSDWDAIRREVLVRDRYLCQVCLKLGVMTEAKQVDHILPKSLGGTNDRGNLQSLCFKCHKRKTNEEAANAKRVIK